jgi:hypothetical protein
MVEIWHAAAALTALSCNKAALTALSCNKVDVAAAEKFLRRTKISWLPICD